MASTATEDNEAIAETDYLLRSPANAMRLTAATEDVRQGRILITKTMPELQALADEGNET